MRVSKELGETQKLSTDPVAAKLNRIGKVERRDTAKGVGYYVESFTRTPKEVAANRPEHPSSVTVVCAGKVALSLALSQRSGTLTVDARQGLARVLASVPRARSPAGASGDRSTNSVAVRSQH